VPIQTDPYIVQFDVHGLVLNQEFVNRYFYSCIAVTDAINDVLEAFHDAVIPPMLTIMSNQAVVLKIVGQSIRGSVAFGERVETEFGIQPGDCSPPFVAWDFTLLRGGALERNGYKRIPGVADNMQSNGSATIGARPDLDAFAAAIGGTFSIGAVDFGPVIRRTKVNHVTQNPPVYYTCSGAQYSRVGSQNSRKFGHGR